MRHRFTLLSLLLAGISIAATSASACTTRDCAEERAGQVRCVANRAELCEADGSLVYTSCTTQGLFCSEDHGGCVTEEIINMTSSSAGGSGAGGNNTGGDPSTSSTGGSAGAGG